MRAAVRTCLFLAVTLLGAAGAGAQQSGLDFWIIERDPGPGTDLATGDALNVRLGYKSDRPVRFRMEGRADGKVVKAGAMYNVAPPYPAGEGEAIVWIAYRQPTAIDEIAITAMDEAWKSLAATSLPVQIGWSAGIPRRQPAAWVGRLNQVQQHMASQSMTRTTDEGGDTLFFLLMPLALLGYFVLQPWAAMRFEGGWRIAALVPLVATVPLVLHAGLALAAGSNLWPLLLMLCLPVATLYLLLLSGVRMLARVAA